MGRRTKIITSCDGPGCDLVNERFDDQPTYDGIHKLELSLNGGAYWRGYLCAPCENKLIKILKDPFGTLTSHKGTET